MAQDGNAQPIEFLFLPERIAGLLANYPHLEENLRAAEREGAESEAFPEARKTARQIYRMIAARPSYPRLQFLLDAIELCLSQQWIPTPLLRTRYLHDFDSHVAELTMANCFLRRGFRVEKVTDTGTPIPDSIVDTGNGSYVVEVYRPRLWEGMHHFLDELRLSVQNLDVRRDFQADIRLDRLREFGENDTPLWFDPQTFSEANTTYEERWNRISAVARELECRLSETTDGRVRCRFEDVDLNCFWEVELRGICISEQALPGRRIFTSGPGLSGYAPEGIFDQIVARGVQNKIRRAQARSFNAGRWSVLIVDVSQLEFPSEFADPYYLQQFNKSAQARIQLDSANYNVVAFCLPDLANAATMQVPLLAKSSDVPDEAVRVLFGA